MSLPQTIRSFVLHEEDKIKMELLSVRLARVIALFPTDEMNPRGRSLYRDVVPAFIERYGFLKYPQKPEEFDELKGVEFENGSWNNLDVRMVLYNTGVLADTRSSTSDSEALIQDALEWVSGSFGLIFKPEMMLRKLYLNEVDIRFDPSLDSINSRLQGFAERLSTRINSLTGQSLSYTANALWMNYDNTLNKAPTAPFRVERLLDSPFNLNKYYASAPLPTDVHLEFLEEFESILKG